MNHFTSSLVKLWLHFFWYSQLFASCIFREFLPPVTYTGRWFDFNNTKDRESILRVGVLQKPATTLTVDLETLHTIDQETISWWVITNIGPSGKNTLDKDFTKKSAMALILDLKLGSRSLLTLINNIWPS